MFTNVSGVYAALWGGGLTLGGVAWTICYQDKIRKEEKMTETKPYVTISNQTDKSGTLVLDSEQLKDISMLYPNDVINLKKTPGKNLYRVNDIYIRNSMNSNILFDKLIINGQEIKTKYDNFIKKGQVFSLQGLFYFYLQDIEMEIVLLDVNLYQYLYKLSFDIEHEEDYFFSLDNSKKKKMPFIRLKAKTIELIKDGAL